MEIKPIVEISINKPTEQQQTILLRKQSTTCRINVSSYEKRDFHKIYYKVHNGLLLYTTIKAEHAEGHYSLSLKNMVPKELVGPEEGVFYLKLFDQNDKETAVLRSNEYQLLQTIKSQMEDAKKNIANIGRPLTVQIHDSHHTSILSSDSGNIQFRGLVNLLVLILLTYTIRAVIDSVEKHDFVLIKEVRAFMNSEIFYDIGNYQTVAAVIMICVFATISFWIEVLASHPKVNRKFIYFIIVANLVGLLIYPIFVSFKIECDPLSASYLMVCSTALTLKLISFHHVMHDNRKLLRKLASEGKVDPDDNQSGLPNDLYLEVLKYPRNLVYKRYFMYLISPTCCYQLIYPKTDRIRTTFMLKRFAEFCLCNFFIVYLIYQHMFPIARESVQYFKEKNYLKILNQTLHMSVPAAYLWLMFFYAFFHSYMNFWGELTQFADRRFYYDWWNAGDLSEYWRKWNFPIHSFLMRHVYYPLRRRQVNRAIALFVTFFTSAVAHEYLMIGIMRKVNFIAFTIMIVNVPIMIVQQKLKNIVNPNLNNLVFWLGYLIIGQPFGIIFCYYQFTQ